MEGFSLILAAFLAIGSFKLADINPDNLQKLTPEKKVELFQKTCNELMTLKAFKEEGETVNFDVLVGFAAEILKNKKAEEVTEKTSLSDVRFQQLAKILDPEKLIGFYSDVCRQKKTEAFEKYKLQEAIDYFLKINNELPAVDALTKALPQIIYLTDEKGNKISEIYKPENRRMWVPYKQIPPDLVKAFVAIEDKRFFQHKGIDENGLVRAFLKSMSGSLQGGSSITQQLTKNLFFKADVQKEKETNDIKITIERKIKELLQTRKIEGKYSKETIIEYYLNLIYLGRNSWGLKIASLNYFGKELSALNLSEMAYLAALPKGPNNYEPNLFLKRALERRDLVLDRMEAALDNAGKPFISKDQKESAKKVQLSFGKPMPSNNITYITDQLKNIIAENKDLSQNNYENIEVVTPINWEVQRAAERSLQDALINFELSHGLNKWAGPLVNIAKYLEQKDTSDQTLPWQEVLKVRSQKFTDVQYDLAVVLEKNTVGLTDGRVFKINSQSVKITRNKLEYGDVIYVTINNNQAQVKHIPVIQGAAIAMDVNNGNVIAATGGFSYQTHPFNRVTKAFSPPGSVLKPFFYLTALQNDFQPNTLVPNTSTVLPKKDGCKPWSPKNFGGEESELETMRYCLENSKNLCVANFMSLYPQGPEGIFKGFRDLMLDLEIYKEPSQCYPLVLGSQATNVYRMARAYAFLANGGQLVKPRFYTKTIVNSVPKDNPVEARPIKSIDAISIAQTKYMLQGVMARGTGSSMKKLSKFIAGKTGTSQSSSSTWFAGISNDVAVVVYLAYDDNRSMGKGATGGDLALPVAASIFQSTFDNYKKPTELVISAPGTVFKNIDFRSGTLTGQGGFPEEFRQTSKEDKFKLIGPRSDMRRGPGRPSFFDQFVDDQPLPSERSQNVKPRNFERPNREDDFFEERRPRRQPTKPWFNNRGQFEDDPFFDNNNQVQMLR